MLRSPSAMPISHALILGITQGITEFLPISSSGHLILFPWFLGWPEHSMVFDVALHMGTLAAILLYFRKDFLKLFQDALRHQQDALQFLGFLIVGTIPGALVGVLGEAAIEEHLRRPIIVGSTLSLVALLLWLVDRLGRKNREIENLHWFDAIAIGTAQSLALIPGVSRAGITMTMGMALGLTRQAAARFSFLLAAPIMLGTGLFEGRKLLCGLPAGETWSTWILGVLTSAIVGILTIHFLLQYLQKNSFRLFVIYRIALGLIVLSLAFH